MGRYFRDGEPNWREIERLARRGFGRFTEMANDPDFGGWGSNLRMGRMLAAGDVRLVALYLIDQQPRHGYDLIKAIEERSNGVYSPSPGLAYPALTYLEEAGYVTSDLDDNKKRYTITDAGRVHLEENRDAVVSTLDFLARAGEQWNRFREFVRRDWPFDEDDAGRAPEAGEGANDLYDDEDNDRAEDVLVDVKTARRELKAAIRKARDGDADTQRRLATLMRRAAADIRALQGDDAAEL